MTCQRRTAWCTHSRQTRRLSPPRGLVTPQQPAARHGSRPSALRCANARQWRVVPAETTPALTKHSAAVRHISGCRRMTCLTIQKIARLEARGRTHSRSVACGALAARLARRRRITHRESAPNTHRHSHGRLQQRGADRQPTHAGHVKVHVTCSTVRRSERAHAACTQGACCCNAAAYAAYVSVLAVCARPKAHECTARTATAT